MPIFVKQNGQWRTVDSPYIKRSGQWILPREAYIKENGQWKLIFEEFAFEVETVGPVEETVDETILTGQLTDFEDFSEAFFFDQSLTNATSATAVATDGTRQLTAIGGGNDTVYVYDKDFALVQTLSAPTDIVNGLDFNSSTNELAVGCEDNNTYIYDSDFNLTNTLTDASGSVNDVAYDDQNSGDLAVASDDGVFYIYDSSYNNTISGTASGAVLSVDYRSSDGAFAFGDVNGSVTVLSGVAILYNSSSYDGRTRLAFSPQGKLAVVDETLVTVLTDNFAVTAQLADSVEGAEGDVVWGENERLAHASTDNRVYVYNNVFTNIATFDDASRQFVAVDWDTKNDYIIGGTAESGSGEAHVFSTGVRMFFDYGQQGQGLPIRERAAGLQSLSQYTLELDGLSNNTIYEYRAGGEAAEGRTVTDDNTLQFQTVDLQVATDPATSVGSVEATLNGDITNFDRSTPDQPRAGFEWGIQGNGFPNTTTVGIISPGTFDETITGLTPNETYEYRAFGEWGGVRQTGTVETFTMQDYNITIDSADWDLDGNTFVSSAELTDGTPVSVNATISQVGSGNSYSYEINERVNGSVNGAVSPVASGTGFTTTSFNDNWTVQTSASDGDTIDYVINVTHINGSTDSTDSPDGTFRLAPTISVSGTSFAAAAGTTSPEEVTVSEDSGLKDLIVKSESGSPPTQITNDTDDVFLLDNSDIGFTVPEGSDDSFTVEYSPEDGFNYDSTSLEYTLSQAGDIVYSIDIGSDYVVYGSDDNNAYLHNLSDGSLQDTLSQSTDDVRGTAIGNGLVAYGGSSGDENVYVHTLTDGEPIYTLTGTSGGIVGIGFSNENIVYAGAGSIAWNDISEGTLVGGFPLSSVAQALDANGDRFVWGAANGDVFVYNLSDGSFDYTLTQESTSATAVGIGDGYVAYGGSDEEVYVHDLSTGSLVQTLTNATDSIQSVDVADDHVVYSSSDQNTYVNRIDDGSLQNTFSDGSNITGSVAIDGLTGYIAMGNLDNNAYVRLGTPVTASSTADLEIGHNAENQANPYTLQIDGSVPPQVTAAFASGQSDPVDFGSVFVSSNTGQSTSTETITVEETSGVGSYDVLTNTEAITNDYTITAPQAPSPITVNSGSTADIDVEFDPDESGTVTGVLEVNHTAASEPNPITIGLTGEGENATELEATSGTSLTAVVDGNDDTTTVTISEVGGDNSATVSDVSESSTQPSSDQPETSEWSISNVPATPFSVSAGGSFTFDVSWNPDANDAQNYNVDVTYDGSGISSGTVLTVTINGTVSGTVTARVDVGEGYTYLDTTVGETRTNTFNVLADADGPYDVTEIDITGTNASDFTIQNAPADVTDNDTNTSVQVGGGNGDLSFNIEFAPSDSNNRVADLEVIHTGTANSSPLIVDLNGVGLEPATLTVTDESGDGTPNPPIEYEAAEGNVDTKLLGLNETGGDNNLTIEAFGLSNSDFTVPFSLDDSVDIIDTNSSDNINDSFQPLTINAGGSLQREIVNFSPVDSTADNPTGTLSVDYSGDGVSGTATLQVDLEGTSLEPATANIPTGDIDFGTWAESNDRNTGGYTSSVASEPFTIEEVFGNEGYTLNSINESGTTFAIDVDDTSSASISAGGSITRNYEFDSGSLNSGGSYSATATLDTDAAQEQNISITASVNIVNSSVSVPADVTRGQSFDATVTWDLFDFSALSSEGEVDWGDGTTTDVTFSSSSGSQTVSHTYGLNEPTGSKTVTFTVYDDSTQTTVLSEDVTVTTLS